MKYFKKFSNTFLIKFSVILLKNFPIFFLLTYEKFSDVFLIKKPIKLMYHLFHMQYYNRYYLISPNGVYLKYNSKDESYEFYTIEYFPSKDTLTAYITKDDIYHSLFIRLFMKNYHLKYSLTLKQKLDVL